MAMRDGHQSNSSWQAAAAAIMLSGGAIIVAFLSSCSDGKPTEVVHGAENGATFNYGVSILAENDHIVIAVTEPLRTVDDSREMVLTDLKVLDALGNPAYDAMVQEAGKKPPTIAYTTVDGGTIVTRSWDLTLRKGVSSGTIDVHQHVGDRQLLRFQSNFDCATGHAR